MGTQDMAAVSVEVEGEEVTNLLLEVVAVTENNGLRLPREFGLLVKQSLYFDRYLKILAPELDVVNDSRVSGLGEQSTGDIGMPRVNGSTEKEDDSVIIDV